MNCGGAPIVDVLKTHGFTEYLLKKIKTKTHNLIFLLVKKVLYTLKKNGTRKKQTMMIP